MKSIANALKLIGLRWEICENPNELELGKFKDIILPGVGSFDFAASELSSRGFRETIQDLAHGNGINLLGICLGMQLLLDGSEEGDLPGLGLIPGIARKFNFNDSHLSLPIPNIGWNSFKFTKEGKVICNFSLLEGARFYFAHSYYASEISQESIYAYSDYGLRFPSIIGNGSVTGFQFHPEKSLKAGLMLLKTYFQG